MTRSLLRSSFAPFGTTIFSTMTALALEHDAINLAQGFPDFDPPPLLPQAAAQAMAAGHHQYAPAIGVPRLRRAIAAHAQACHGLRYDPDREVTVTVGATEALWSATLALVEPGDEVVLIEPYYDAYAVHAAAAGAVPRYVRTEFPHFHLDGERLAAAFGPRTRLVYLNTPVNPSGRILGREELEEIARLAAAADAIILADEAYEHLVYDGATHLSPATVADLRERTVVIGSASKTFSITGWRIGWALAPPEITDALRRVHQYVTFAPATPLQHAVAAALEWAASGDYFTTLSADYQQRRDTLLAGLAEAGYETTAPAGAFFVVARAADGEDDVEHCRRLTVERGVSAIPVSSFFHDGGVRDLVRFMFAKDVATLERACDRLIGG